MQLPSPQPGETQADFAVRAHGLLRGVIPETDKRNAAIFERYRQARHDPLEAVADRQFPADKFRLLRDVPVFCEHETTNSDGTPAKYSLEDLRLIADKCNERIADTGSFAALSFGHTPEKETVDTPMPQTAGYAGPFYIGQIGNVKPRWAIFSSERWMAEHAGKAVAYSRRSPEVWRFPNMADRFFDPIAVLGAEAPRLDMGVRFCRTASGEMVEKYSAASTPAANCNFVPGHVGRKEKYDATPTGAKPMALAPEDIQQIVEAVMATAPMQWVTSQMQAEAAPQAGDVPGDGMPAGDGMPGMDAPGGPPGMDAPGGPPPMPGADGPPPFPKPEEKDKNGMDQYSQRAATQTARERYARAEAENADLKKRVAAIEQDKIKTERYSKLVELRNVRAFDLESEVADAMRMSGDEFTRHIGRIEKNYERIPVGGVSLYTEHLPPAGQREQYSAQQVAKATRMALDSNGNLTYEAALEQVAKAG